MLLHAALGAAALRARSSHTRPSPRPAPRGRAPGRRGAAGRGGVVLASGEKERPSEEPSSASKTLERLAKLFPEPEKLQATLVEPSAAKAQPASDTTPPADATTEELERFLSSIKARSEKSALSDAEQATMRRDFERMLEAMSQAAEVPPADVAALRSQVFGYATFWVTGSEASVEYPGGVLFRGNLRGGGNAAEVYATVSAGVRRLFGDKYTLLVVEEPPRVLTAADGAAAATAASEGGAGAAEEAVRCAFVVLPSALAQPTPTTGWQSALAALLALLTLGASTELGLEAQLAQLPAETLQFFASPGALDALPPGTPIPGLDSFSPAALLAAALPITCGVLAVAAAHEAGHAFVARRLGVQLSPPFLIPNASLGTFGAVTQIKSLLASREQLLDVALAGPAAGGAAAAALFLFGLAASCGAQEALPLAQGAEAVRAAALAAGLVPVPSALFQGSLLLGGLSAQLLHPVAGAETFVHPAMVAGWCGLTITALNSLPVGALDGGRVALAAFGRRRLTALSVLVYIGLALGLLGGGLSLSWGLYVLIVQRVPERTPANGITPPGEGRQRAATLLATLSLLTLLPLSLSLPPGAL